MTDQEKLKNVISDLELQIAWIRDNDFHKFPGWGHSVLAMRDALEMLKEQEAKPPIHIHKEYPEHDWKREENGEIDDFALDVDYHNGPVCKRCNYAFCIHCDPNGWNKRPCIIDKYNCPKCRKYISKSNKFCPDCGQAVKWDD